ncbi:hypothetical protein [Clostridium tarantellae]|uniref:Uncharacterized protein n=1 Tax=Clostridium tarantellae TaxID=39493 RepID=A0A6I1MMG3_9CLOT|nr:hypothetical protein [Clostridium tarantellae]MPQ44686.1 hypothetical protein [Clostridium tarantellae]
MLNIKRDWNWGFKCTSIGYMLLAIICGIFAIIFKGNSNSIINFFVSISTKVVDASVYVLAFFPLASFIGLSPIYFKRNVNVGVSHLPYSKKQLFLKGLPTWLIVYLSFVLISVIISSIIHTQYVPFSFKNVFIFNIILTVSTIFVLLAFQLQIIAAIIFTFAKNIKWYITLIFCIILNILMVSITMFSFNKFNLNMQNGTTYIYLLIGIFVIFSAIIFSISWIYVEKMYK